MSKHSPLVAAALRYLKNRDPAPKLVAKGRGKIAQKIVQIAKSQGIPVHQDSDLVEVLVRLELEQYIPPELYKVIAEILAFIYLVNEKAKTA